MDVNGLTAVSQIAAGYAHTCFLLSTGKVKCTGQNDKGQLGNGSIIDSNTLVDVHTSSQDANSLANVRQIVAGGSHTCFLLSSGEVKCTGWNNAGQLGNGSTTNSLYPVGILTALKNELRKHYSFTKQ